MTTMNIDSIKISESSSIKLDAICSFSFNMEYLKEVIRYLYMQIMSHNNTLNDICKKVDIKMEKTNKTDSKVPGIFDRITKLESEMNNMMEILNSQKDLINPDKSSLGPNISEIKNLNLSPLKGSSQQNSSNINIIKIDSSILKLGTKDPVTNENLIQQVEGLNSNIKAIFDKINNINSNLNALISKEGGDDSKSLNAKETIGSEDIIKKIKKDIKTQYTEASDFQIVNVANEKKFGKVDALLKEINEKIDAKNLEGIRKMNEINAKILKLDMENKDLQNKVASLQDIGEINPSESQVNSLEDKGKEENSLSKSQIKTEENKNLNSNSNPDPNELPNSEGFIPHSVNKESKVSKDSKISSKLKDLVNKNSDMQIQINLLRQKIQNSSHQEPLNENELIEKIKEAILLNEKIASKLDVKTLKAVVDDLNSRFENLKKDYEINVIQSKEKTPSQMIEDIKQSFVSLDNRVSLMSKNFKVLEMRLNELSSFPQTERVVEKEHSSDKNDERIDAISDDFNEKIASIRDSITDLKNDYNRFTHVVESKVDGKVGKDDIIYLEGKIYKELDRIVSTLTKKIYSKADSTRLADIEAKLRRLMFEVFESGVSHREIKEEAMFTKKPLGGISCASCEKEITNAFSEHPKDLFNAWNKFPQKDLIENLQSKFYPNIRKKKKRDDQLSLSEQKAKNFLEMQSKLSYLGHPINKSREELLINENEKSRASLPLLKQNTLKE